MLWEFGTLQFKKSVWNKMKAAIFKSPQKEQIRVELQALRTEHARNETKLETLCDDKNEGSITKERWLTWKEKIENR